MRTIAALLSRININQVRQKHAIKRAILIFCLSQIPISNKTPKEALDELLLTAKLLIEAAHRLVSTVGGPSNLITEAAHHYVKCLDRFVSAGLEVAYHQQVGRINTGLHDLSAYVILRFRTRLSGSRSSKP